MQVEAVDQEGRLLHRAEVEVGEEGTVLWVDVLRQAGRAFNRRVEAGRSFGLGQLAGRRLRPLELLGGDGRPMESSTLYTPLPAGDITVRARAEQARVKPKDKKDKEDKEYQAKIRRACDYKNWTAMKKAIRKKNVIAKFERLNRKHKRFDLEIYNKKKEEQMEKQQKHKKGTKEKTKRNYFF